MHKPNKKRTQANYQTHARSATKADTYKNIYKQLIKNPNRIPGKSTNWFTWSLILTRWCNRGIISIVALWGMCFVHNLVVFSWNYTTLLFHIPPTPIYFAWADFSCDDAEATLSKARYVLTTYVKKMKEQMKYFQRKIFEIWNFVNNNRKRH